MRWLLLDEIEAIEKGTKARTTSHIPDSFFSPELGMMEMMAQTGGLLLGAEDDFNQDLIFAKIENAEFFAPWQAGEKIKIRAASGSLRPEGAWFEGSIEAGERKIASARFLLMSVGRLAGNRPVTFHDAFMKHFKVRERVRSIE